MLRFNFICFAFLSVISSVVCTCENYPVCNAYGDQTLSPLALITRDAKPVSVSPFLINVPENARVLLRNLGFIVRGYPVESGPSITVTRGPAGRDVYSFYFVCHLNDGLPENTRCLSSENGKGSSVQFAVYFYNTKYETYEEAIKHKDGFLAMTVPVTVRGNVPNRSVQQYLSALSKIREPFTNATVPAKQVCSWLFEALLNCDTYYIYPGSVDATPGGYQYSATYVIQLSLRDSLVISYDQFCQFLSVLNSGRQPLTLTIPAYPRGNRQIYEVSSPYTEIKYSR